MCTKVACETCKKSTWAGCGEHIEEALEGVAEADRCACRVLLAENYLNAYRFTRYSP